uniref:MADF domain-containing protein n=1 Tax=Heliothis virescens TaxID=7102 RepID=A0A2A4JUX5_HELVI
MVAILANPKWSEDLTIQMIIEYEKREYLWNPVSEHYKNKKIREQGYIEIINALNLVDVTVKELKNKIKNIRSSYSVELKKIRAARKAGAHAYRPSVTWFEHADRFLRAIVTPSSVDNSLVEIPASDDSDVVQDLSERKSPEKKSPRKRRSSTRSSTPYVLNTPSPRPGTPFGLSQGTFGILPPVTSAPFLNPPVGIATPLTTSLATIYPVPTKQKKSNSDSGDHTDLPQDLSQHSENGNENEFEMFGKLIASQLRKLPLSLALDTQLKIQTLVNAARIQAVYQQYSYAGPSQEALSVQALSNGILAGMATQSSFTSRTLGLENDSPDEMNRDLKTIEYSLGSEAED